MVSLQPFPDKLKFLLSGVSFGFRFHFVVRNNNNLYPSVFSTACIRFVARDRLFSSHSLSFNPSGSKTLGNCIAFYRRSTTLRQTLVVRGLTNIVGMSHYQYIRVSVFVHRFNQLTDILFRICFQIRLVKIKQNTRIEFHNNTLSGLDHLGTGYRILNFGSLLVHLFTNQSTGNTTQGSTNNGTNGCISSLISDDRTDSSTCTSANSSPFLRVGQ